MSGASPTKDPPSELAQGPRVNFNIVTLPDGIIEFTATPKLLDHRRKKREQKLWPTTRMPRRVISPQEIADISGMMTLLDFGTSDTACAQNPGIDEPKNPFDVARPTLSRRRRLKAVRKCDMKCDHTNSPSTPGRNAKHAKFRFGYPADPKSSGSFQAIKSSAEQTGLRFTFTVPTTRDTSAGNDAQSLSDQPHIRWHGLYRKGFVPRVIEESNLECGGMLKGSTRCRYQCLTTMNEYDQKSFEELRLEDYLSGRSLCKTMSHYGPKFKAPFTSENYTVRGVPRLVKGYIQCISAMREYEDRSFEELRIEHYAPSLGWKDRDRYSLSSEELQQLPIALDSEIFFYGDSRKKGKVRFIGRLPHKSPKDIFVGVELDDSSGLGNGCSGGVRLFRTKDLCAEFVPLDSALPGYLIDSEDEKADAQVLDESPSSSSDSKGNKCAVCWTNEVQMFFLPCGHVCCCERCSKSMKDCPICRKRIKQKHRAFLT